MIRRREAGPAQARPKERVTTTKSDHEATPAQSLLANIGVARRSRADRDVDPSSPKSPKSVVGSAGNRSVIRGPTERTATMGGGARAEVMTS